MREIKFRLRQDNKIVGYERVSWQDKDTGISFLHIYWEYSVDNIIWNDKYIQHNNKDQYIGLKDKNGKEIYENDIIGTRKEHCWQVVYVDNGFYFCFLGTNNPIANNMVYYEMNRFEVFGNIKENPELLKGQERN